MENNLLETIKKIIFALIIILSAFSLLLVLPFTLDIFEFNKLIALMIITSLALILWGVKTVLAKKIEFTKSPIDLGLGLVLASGIASTVTSLSKYPSLVGQYGRFMPSILTAVMFFSLYYVAVNNLEGKKTEILLKLVFFLTALASLIGTLSYFDVLYLITKSPYLQSRAFNTIGSTTALGIICGALSGVGLLYLIKPGEGKTNIAWRALLFITTLFTIYYIILVRIPAAYISLAISILVVITTSKITSGKSRAYIISLASAALILASAMYIPTISKELGLDKFPPLSQETILDTNTSWQIAAGSLRDFPIVGSGLSTYIFDFTSYKPISINSTSLWNTRFTRAGNEPLTVLAEQGILGGIALSVFAFLLIRTIIKAKSKNIAVSGALISLLAGLLMYPATISTMAMLMILTAIFIASQKNNPGSSIEEVSLSLSAIQNKFLSITGENSKSEILPYIFLAVTLFISLPTIFAGYRGFWGEYYHKEALFAYASGNLPLAYTYYRSSLSQNPLYDTPRREYSDINMILANAIASNGSTLSDQDKTDIQNLINQAINQTSLLTQAVNPINVVNWEQRARVYDQLTKIDKNAVALATSAIKQAIQIDPANPVLRVGSASTVGLGGLYYGSADYQNAALSFVDAINLKPDYANAYFNLASAQHELKLYDAAATNMEIVLRLIPNDSSDYKTAKDILDQYKKDAENAKAAVETPAQGEAAATPKLTQNTTEQTPLTPPQEQGKAF